MKNFSLLHKTLLGLNIVAALLLLLTVLTPFLSVLRFPFLSILSLGVPLLFILNFLFSLYWFFSREWRLVILCLLCIVVTYMAHGTFFKPFAKPKNVLDNDVKVLSYNVRRFNRGGQFSSQTIFEDIKRLIDKEDADIICIQEVDHRRQKEFQKYPYRYLEYIYMQNKNRLAIFSKFPIVDVDLLCFPETSGLGAYADIAIKNDTIRIYNLHLQSLGITPGQGVIRKSSSKKLYSQLAYAFSKHEEQAEFFLEHSKDVKYPQIVCGDFNNTQFSRAYNLIKGNKKDTFLEMGKGYGRTYLFHGIPARIDFILADPEFEVISHKNFDEKYSDHYPVSATFRLGR